MELESRNIFIDTQYFVKMGLDFNHHILQSFLSLCKNRNLQYLTTSVVKREVESKIEDSIKEGLNSLRGFRRKARLLRNIEDERIKDLFYEIEEKEIYEKALSVFEDFIRESNCIILSANNVDPETILSLYFKKKAPFGDGKKKTEFPDAISLFSLLHQLGEEKAYVISDDPDLKYFCDDHEQLISIESLDKFLDLYNEHESAITKIVKKHISNSVTLIKQKIAEYINHAGAYNEAPWENSEVDNFSVITVHDIEPYVVWVNEEECLVTFDVDVDYEYTVSGPDYEGGFYDKEDGRVYTFGTTSHSESTTNTFTIELGLSYELENGELEGVDETTFHIAGLSDGVAVNVEEYGSDFW